MVVVKKVKEQKTLTKERKIHTRNGRKTSHEHEGKGTSHGEGGAP